MYHSLTFTDDIANIGSGSFVGINTWEDWHLIPASRPTIPPPQPQKQLIAIPGRDGTIDMSEYLTGGVIYADISGQFQFYVDNGHEYWITIYRNIATYLHGKQIYMCMTDDDPYFYYVGRFTVNAWASEAANSKITIDYRLKPYKYSVDTHEPL